MRIIIAGKEFTVTPHGHTLIQAIYLSNLVEPASMCGGLGACAKCRVRFLPQSKHIPPALPEDVKLLSSDLTENGWRLSCKHKPVKGAVLELPEYIQLSPEYNNPANANVPQTLSTARQENTKAVLAVDFGSTSLHFKPLLITKPSKGTHADNGFATTGPTASGPTTSPQIAGSATTSSSKAAEQLVTEFATQVKINPQMGAGADIISRVAYALEDDGLAILSQISRTALTTMLNKAQTESPNAISEICLAANSAMTMLILGKNIKGLAGAPYSLDYAGGQYEQLPELPPMWVAPLIAPFIGGDISAGYASLALNPAIQPEFPFILADMGTNGEFVLALSFDTAFAVSVPLGPALEGTGMRCGAEARDGVITSFTLSPTGLSPQILRQIKQGAAANAELLNSPAARAQSSNANCTQQTTLPVGISGSGYISLVAQLCKNNIIDSAGMLQKDSTQVSPLTRKLVQGLSKIHDEAVWQLPNSQLALYASDIEELLKIKAAFALAVKYLLQAANINFSDLKKLYLAGSLGSHVQVYDLETLGFIPPGSGTKVQVAGNTALAGATLLATQPALRPLLNNWAKQVQVVNMLDDATFQTAYTDAMQFVWQARGA
ncbi:ASKHA domain-containing protein [Desulfovibrio sp. OttesenSCG-928-F07]|nr:ASKHA domain-containing protein [Desulfovibrio sp. OttesenSCG-928-F07]